MWLVASAFVLRPSPTLPPMELETCDNGTLPAQVIAIGTEPHELFMLAPGWGDPRYQARCEALYPGAPCDPADYDYPSREAMAEHFDLEGVNLRYTIILQTGRPLEVHVEGFTGGTEVLDAAYDLVSQTLDPRAQSDRLRERAIRQIFHGAL